MLSSALLLGSPPLTPLQASAAVNQYEFEKGTITVSGENHAEIEAVKGASVGKAVNLRDGGNKVSLTVNAAEEGAHRITLRYTTLTDEQVTGILNAQPDIRRTPGIAGRSDYFSSAIKSACSY